MDQYKDNEDQRIKRNSNPSVLLKSMYAVMNLMLNEFNVTKIIQFLQHAMYRR